MRIEELYIENFRCIHKLEVKDLAYLNVIAGLNGSGKSSVLTAIKSNIPNAVQNQNIKQSFR